MNLEMSSMSSPEEIDLNRKQLLFPVDSKPPWTLVILYALQVCMLNCRNSFDFTLFRHLIFLWNSFNVPNIMQKQKIKKYQV